MASGVFDPIQIPSGFWDRPDTRAALRAHDVSGLFGLVRRYAGASQTRIGMATGLPQGKVSEIIQGKRRVESFDVLTRIATGLGMADQARIEFGLAPTGTATDAKAAPGLAERSPSETTLPAAIPPEDGGAAPLAVDELANMLTGSLHRVDGRASGTRAELAVGSTPRPSPSPEHVVLSDGDESGTHASRAADIAIPRGPSTATHESGEMFHLRRILMGCIPDTQPATQMELTAAVVSVWDLFFAARFGDMQRALPVALARAYSATEAATGESRRRANIALAQLLHATSNLLGYVAQEDLATVALIRADALAAENGDELTRAAIQGSQSWLFAKNGMFDHAVAYAERAATDIEPRLSTATPRHVSIWGELLCYAAFAASRTGDCGQARRYLRLCESAGSQLEDDYVSRPEASNMFGRTSAASFGVVNEIAAEQPREALKLADGSESCTGVPPVLRSRRLINVAHAQVENWDNAAAVSTLHKACSMAPEFIGHIGLAHTLTSELLTRRGKQRLNGLVDIAKHIGVPV